jgi:hypothetical protein
MYISALLAKQRDFAQKNARLLVFFILCVVLSVFWLAPFLAAKSAPDAILNKTIVQTINKNTYLPDPLLLKGYWLANKDNYYSPYTETFQYILNWLPLFIVITVLFITYKSKKNIFYPILLIFLTGLFLSSSTTASNFVYDKLMFGLPSKGLGWMLREYDKFGLVISYVYALCIAILVSAMSKKKALAIITLVVIAVFTSNLFYLGRTLKLEYTPVEIPKDFSDINFYLSGDKEEFNVVWYPGVPTPIGQKQRKLGMFSPT